MSTARINAALAAMVFGAAALVAVLGSNLTPNYPDFIVGSITWSASNKLQDLLAWPAFICAFFLAFTALSAMAAKLRDHHGDGVAAGFTSQMIGWSLPFYVGAGALVLGGSLDPRAIALSALGIAFIAAIACFYRPSRGEPDVDLWGLSFLVIALISLIPIEIAVLLSRAPTCLAAHADVSLLSRTSHALIAIGFVLGVVVWVKYERNLRRHVAACFFAAQLGLPLFYLTLYPAKLLQPSGELVAYNTTIHFKVLVVGLVSFGFYDVTRRLWVYSQGNRWRQLLSPYAIFGLLVALKVGSTLPPHLSSDDYHFGERLLGWWSYSHGALPYVDYIPAHGLFEDDFWMLLSSIFYDGTAASVSDAGRLAFAVLAFFAFSSIYRFSGSLVLASMVVLSMGERLTPLFLTPFICLWLWPRLRRCPEKWLATWMVTAPIVILGAPPQGVVVVVAFGFLAVRLMWEQIRRGNRHSWRYIVGSVVLILSALLLTPVHSMLFGAIRYVLENGAINQLAYGVPWSESWNEGVKSDLFFEATRMSWAGMALICLYFIQRNWRDYRNTQSPFYPAVIFLFFILLLMPYAMGRIGIGTLSRPGRVSVLCWVLLFPLLVWGMVKGVSKSGVVWFVALMGSLVGSDKPNFLNVFSGASAKVSTAPLRDAVKAGLGNVGLAHMEENHWRRITRLDAFLKSRLHADETYLDLTSRNAHYFYVNRRPAMAVTAPYNMAPLGQQRRTVEAFATNLPKIALLWAENITHDGGGLALRSPYLYRFVVDNYTPRFESGFIVGYRRPEALPPRDNLIVAELNAVTDANWQGGMHRHEAAVVLNDPVLGSMLRVGDRVCLGGDAWRTIGRVSADGAALWLDGGPINSAEGGHLNSVEVEVAPQVYHEYTASLFQRSFAVTDFQKIAISWGRSEKLLAAKMALIATWDGASLDRPPISPGYANPKVRDSDRQLNFDISGFGISGHNAGLLKFDFVCVDGRGEPRLRIFWWGDDRGGPFEASSIKVTAENGTLIVPLDASPWWLILRQVKGIRIDLDNATACHSFALKNMGLYQRVYD